jgi:hypothetical protein
VWHKGEDTYYIMFEKARQHGMNITGSIDHTALVSGRRLTACCKAFPDTGAGRRRHGLCAYMLLLMVASYSRSSS